MTKKRLVDAVIGEDVISALTPEQRAKIDQEAVAQVAVEHQEKAAKEYKRQRVAEERKKKGLVKDEPAPELRTIMLDLAGHSDRIMLDGRIFFHGHTYRVPKAVYDVMMEVQQRGWEHEDEIGGANRNVYRRPLNPVLRPGPGQHGAVTTSDDL